MSNNQTIPARSWLLIKHHRRCTSLDAETPTKTTPGLFAPFGYGHRSCPAANFIGDIAKTMLTLISVSRNLQNQQTAKVQLSNTHKIK